MSAPEKAGATDKPADDQAEKTAPDPTAQWTAAIARVRDTNAWVIKAFVALTGVLIGSGPVLLKLGDLPSTPRVVIAAVMALAALFGVGLVIHQATTVMLPETTDLPDLVDATDGPLATLRAHVEKYPYAYLGEADTVEGLVTEYREWRTTTIQLTELTAGTALDADASKAATTALAAARAQLASLRSRFDDLLAQAVYAEVRGKFERARPRMYAGAALAAVGTAVYLGALGIDLGKSADKAAEPGGGGGGATVATLHWALATPDAERLRGVLELTGPKCDAIPVAYTGKGSFEDPWQVTTIPTGDCGTTPITFTIDNRYGMVAKEQPTKYELKAPVKKRADPVAIAAAALVALVVGVGGTAWVRRRTK